MTCRLSGSAGIYTVYRVSTRRGEEEIGDVVYGDYGAYGRGWAAVTQSRIAYADPVVNAGSPVFPTRREAVAYLRMVVA